MVSLLTVRASRVLFLALDAPELVLGLLLCLLHSGVLHVDVLGLGEFEVSRLNFAAQKAGNLLRDFGLMV